MALTNLVWMLTGLGAVVVLITRTRLRATEAQSGVTEVPSTVVNLHTLVGVVAIATWIWWLAGGPLVAGWIGLAFWWLLTLIGLVVLARWLPSHGSHSNPSSDDGMAQGPWLSLLGHLGTLAGVAFFTWFFLADKL